MSDLGSLIHCTRDDEGEIHVYENSRCRYLTFGNQVEQSCLELADPLRLQHVYTQAMMLGPLLAGERRSALLLGVGGGSLARALRGADRGLRITGVERRAAVIDTARGWFGLPGDARFSLHETDADGFLRADDRCYDLVFADLYLADGVYPGQVSEGFLSRCRDRLDGQGVLAVNQWASDYLATRDALATLDAVFDGRVLTLHVQGGNIIAFAFRDALPALRRDEWFDAAQALGLRLRIPLQRHARNLWRQNAELLGTGRFRHRVR